MILTSDTFKKQYRDIMRNKQGNNIWNEAYNAIGMYEKSNIASLDYDYGKAMGEAYVAAQGQKNLVAESGLGKGFKQELYSDIDETMQDAYNQYKNNYVQNYAGIVEQANQYREQVSSDLDEIAKKTALTENSMYDYLQYLYEDPVANKLFTGNDVRWNEYVNRDDEGNIVGLKSKDEIYKLGLYDEKPVYDEQGNIIGYENYLNEKGTRYYDKLMNWMPENEDNYLSYEEWLYSQNDVEKSQYKGLYDWYKSYNPYASSLTNPSNSGLIRTAFGMVSSDYTWSFIEDMGYMTNEQIEGLFSDFKAKGEEIQKTIDKKTLNAKDKGKELISDIKSYTSSLKDMADKFGIAGEMEAQLAGGWEGFEKKLQDYIEGTRTSGEMTGDWFTSFLTAGLGGQVGTAIEAGAAAGTAIAGGAGTAMLTAGASAASATGVGAIVVAAAALAVGAVSGSIGVDEQRKQNEAYAKQAKTMYDNLLAAMTNVALEKKKEAQIKEYERRRNQFI